MDTLIIYVFIFYFIFYLFLLHKKLLNYLLFNGILWLMRTIKDTPQSHIVFVCIFRNAQHLFIGRQVWFQVVSFNLHTLKCILYIYSYIVTFTIYSCLWAYSGEWATRMTDKLSARSRVLKIYIQLWFLYCLFFFLSAVPRLLFSVVVGVFAVFYNNLCSYHFSIQCVRNRCTRSIVSVYLGERSYATTTAIQSDRVCQRDNGTGFIRRSSG